MTTVICPLYTWIGDHATISDRLMQLRPGDVAIMNPGNGPGVEYNPEVAAGVDYIKSLGITVAGYVPLGYGANPLGNVLEHLDHWYRWYNVVHPFYDEVAAELTQHELGTLWGAARCWQGGQRKLVVFNPGTGMSNINTVPDGTVVCTFEGTKPENAALPTATRPWEYAIVHSVPGGVPDELVRAALRGYQYVYATHDELPNPFDGVGIPLHV